MNSQFHKWLVSIMVFFCLTLAASSVVAKKPIKPDPDPGIDGAACVDSLSYFPAFVYSVSGNEIFLSNAAGDCSISIYKTDRTIGGNPSHLSYRLFGDSSPFTGVIAWSEQYRDDDRVWYPSKIQLLSFTVQDGEIVEPLPIEPILLLEAQYAPPVGNVYAADLSPEGDRVVFAGYENNSDNYFIDETIIDCAPLCRSRIYETQPDAYGDNVSIHQPLYSLDKQRIYFELDYPDRRLVFIEKDESGWSDPVLILAHEDGDLDVGAIGYWDHDGDSFAQEVIAHPRRLLDYDTIEILDIEACLATEPHGGDDCVVIGSRSDEGIVIEGFAPSFTSFTGEPPDLLYLVETKRGPAVHEFDLSGLSERTAINAIKDKNLWVWGVDAAD